MIKFVISCTSKPQVAPEVIFIAVCVLGVQGDMAK